MAATWKCNCLNVTVHLMENPVPIPPEDAQFAWVKQKTKFGSLARASVSLAGVKVNQSKLAEAVQLSHEGIEWTLWRCLNCNCDVHLAPVTSDSSFSLVNLSIPQNDISDKVSLFGLALESNEEALHSILEGPDESNEEAFACFKQLHRQLKDNLERENKKMDERIEEFTRLQHEAFQEFQTRVYRERKILWNKICAVNHWQGSRSSTPSQPTRHMANPPRQQPPTTTAVQDELVGLNNENIVESITQLASLSQQQQEQEQLKKAQQSRKPQPAKVKRSESFHLDDSQMEIESSEGQKTDSTAPQQTPSKRLKKESRGRKLDQLDINVFSFDEDYVNAEQYLSEDEEEEKVEDFVRPPSPVTKKVADLYGSSVPIAIPRNLLSKSHTNEPEKVAASNKLQRQKSKEVTISMEMTSAEGIPSEEMLSQSFDVPYSRNRTTSLMSTRMSVV